MTAPAAVSSNDQINNTEAAPELAISAASDEGAVNTAVSGVAVEAATKDLYLSM